MKKLVRLDKINNIHYDYKLVNYFDPDFIFVPIYDNVLMNITDNDNVLINQILLEGTDKYYTSKISGSVINTCKKSVLGKKYDCLTVENDYKEKKLNILNNNEKIKDFNDLNNLLEKVHLNNIKSKLNIKNPRKLILNGITDDIGVFNNSTYLNEFSDDILDALDYLAKLLKIDTILVTLKNNETNNITTFLSIIGSYPNIKLVIIPDEYLLQKDYFLLDKLNMNINDTIILHPREALEVFYSIKYKKRLDTKYITINGNAVNKSYVINTKIYTSLKSLVNKYYKLKNNERFIVNGLMCGHEINLDEEIITDETESLFIMNNTNADADLCINCGKCYEFCPLKINPKMAMEQNKKNKNCLDCGLCSYVCPSNINLREYLCGEKND